MLFFEPTFVAFFIVYFALHLMVPARSRLWLIIVGSTVFYAWWRPEYVGLPYILTVLAWGGTVWLAATDNVAQRRLRLAVTLILTFLPLAVVKYAYFVTNDMLGLRGIIDTDRFRWPLPLGISFITFTLSAYAIDVYRRQYAVAYSLKPLLGYVLFFPHLIAGPILRPHELMPQFRHMREAGGARFMTGLSIFTLGLAKKLIFADTIAEVVDKVYSGHAGVNSWEYLIAIYGFSVQIYCDFSGYTDMAIGLAYLLRIRLPTNFRQPYLAISVVDFWHRWHITLSRWLRDYLYIPLGGNRGGQSFQFRNIMITMLLGGLWHGASWGFLIWGGLHGVALGIIHLVRRPLKALNIAIPAWVGMIATFHFVSFAWIYFRARDLRTAHGIIGGMLNGSWENPLLVFQRNSFVVVLIFVFMALHRFDCHALVRLGVRRTSRAIIIPAIALCWLLAIAIGQGSSDKFIYFDF